ncbi:MAG: hypothetical protein HY785_13125 [Oscillatoriophycideae cyanobacterium NC_groundwater_1537_Pr4_S-0.65um_50_18]|nr:hypothetical protein [Oscillatoriophycideae cyanobacterium NC_groundwater_1537_Pr4_S-0.65um_50_18]
MPSVADRPMLSSSKHIALSIQDFPAIAVSLCRFRGGDRANIFFSQMRSLHNIRIMAD